MCYHIDYTIQELFNFSKGTKFITNFDNNESTFEVFINEVENIEENNIDPNEEVKISV